MSKLDPEHIRTLMEDRAIWSDTRMGKKTTVVCCTLPNGFEIIGSSSCVSEENYNHTLGVSLAKKKIEDQIWLLEGYVLQGLLYQEAQTA